MAVVRLPTGAERYDIDWCVEVGASVVAGQPLAWLGAPGRCGLEALAAPVSGVVVTRWTSLLTSARGGEAVASVGGVEGVVRGGEARALAARLDEVEAEVRVIRERLVGRGGAGAALLEADLTRLTRWLDAARGVTGS
ncbi:MAG: hypothetical protein AMXMBFR34_08360 [Myxococcaceae bacterium]